MIDPSQVKIANRIPARPADVKEVTADDVRVALQGLVNPAVIEVATQAQARFWRFGTKFFFDDPEEDEPINFTDLRYNSKLGLHSVDEA